MQAPVARPPHPVETVCLWLTGACLVAMLAVILVEVVTRSLFNYSFEIVDEVGGYLTVAISFLALAPAQARKAFHSVELVQSRLSARARVGWHALFTALSLAFSIVLAITTARFVYRSWQQGEVAPTALQTPLWIPQSVMVLGMAALCFVLAVDLVSAVKQLGFGKRSHVA
jgi:TRAP-type C4-dicarboxylate transport system permease small subunit